MAKRTKGSRAQGMVIDWYGDILIKELDDDVTQALFEAAKVVIELATPKAPRDEGTLQESGYAATINQSTYIKRPHHKREVRPRSKGVAVAAFSAPHAHLIEFGTVHMSARPFFRPAIDEGKDDITAAAVTTLRKGLKDVRTG